jgi:hypothetical protein
MKRLTLFSLFLTALPTFAQFEGEIEMKMTVIDKDGASMGGGASKIAISKAGMRSEMSLEMPRMAGMSMNTVTLMKTDSPDIVYRLDEAKHTYTEMDKAKMRGMTAQRQDDEKWTVEKLGEEKVIGYKTVHVLAKHKSTSMELWTAKEFLDLETYRKMQSSRAQMSDGMMNALKEAGADGMPLKSLITNEDGTRITMEIIRADKKSLPASTFEIPAGYTKSTGMDTIGGLSGPGADETRKRMEEMMKNMTPEQRQRMEQMMKQRSGATQ